MPTKTTTKDTAAASPTGVTVGKYTEVNRKCSTIIDKKTKQMCDMFPADHSWTEPDPPERKDGESDAAYARRIASDTKYQEERNKAQFTRGKPHRTDLSSCQAYTDDPDREVE